MRLDEKKTWSTSTSHQQYSTVQSTHLDLMMIKTKTDSSKPISSPSSTLQYHLTTPGPGRASQWRDSCRVRERQHLNTKSLWHLRCSSIIHIHSGGLWCNMHFQNYVGSCTWSETIECSFSQHPSNFSIKTYSESPYSNKSCTGESWCLNTPPIPQEHWPITSRQSTKLYELWHSKTSAYNQLRVIGCLAFVQLRKNLKHHAKGSDAWISRRYEFRLQNRRQKVLQTFILFPFANSDLFAGE